MRPLELMLDLSIVRLSKDPSVFLLKTNCAEDDRLALTKHALEKGVEYSGTSGGDNIEQRTYRLLLGFTRMKHPRS